MSSPKEIAPSKAVAAKTIYEAFTILKEAGGQLTGKEIMDKLAQRVQFTDWEKEPLEKTGNTRWKSVFQFYSVDCTKAGYLQKSNGVWYITPEGEAAHKKLNPIEFLESVVEGFQKWKAANSKEPVKQTSDNTITEIIENNIEQAQIATIEQMEEEAIQGIKDHIIQKNPYEFQDLVAALLRAMGYYTPFVSPKGKDGGIDIIAYQDPLGIKTPRLKVQVKHYPQNPIAADAIRSLKGLVNSGEEVGLFVTSGRFSNEAERFAREANVHIKLIDGQEFIALWKQFYNVMNDDDKNLLPLHPIYFLGSHE
jgi:restriction system protein